MIVSSSLALPAAQPRRRYKLGLQLFTMRADMARDVVGTLKRVAAMGYEDFETYGFNPEAIGYYGMPAKEFAQRLRDLNLTTSSGHYDLNRFVSSSVDDFKRYVDRSIEGARVLGHEYITWPYLDEGTERSRNSRSLLSASTSRAHRSRKPDCKSPITTTTSSSSSRTDRSDTTSSSRKPIPRSSSYKSISTGSRAARS